MKEIKPICKNCGEEISVSGVAVGNNEVWLISSYEGCIINFRTVISVDELLLLMTGTYQGGKLHEC